MIDLAALPMGSLFAGVGGLELGLEWFGVGRVVWQVEIDPWCRGVLAMHWPKAKRYSDVRRVGGVGSVDVLERVGIICGGFPCQDLSVAGKGEGLEGARSGLWREQFRIIVELRPLVVVIENVAALASRGLDRVVADLVSAGYDVEARIIAAADVGAPHRRARLFVVGILADAERGRLRLVEQRQPARWARGVCDGGEAEPEHDSESGRGLAQSRVGGGAHGIADRVDRWPARPGEPVSLWEPARAVRSYSPTRALRLHALGNACVPQCLSLVADRIRERLA